MDAAVSPTLTRLADALAASSMMQSFVAPLMTGLCIAASLGCTFFLVVGGTQYMSSRGKPENLEHAKRTIKNALIGLVVVLAAATLTAILTHAYSMSSSAVTDKLPTLAPIQPTSTGGFWDIIIKSIVHVLQAIVGSIGQPFVQALAFFTKSTPLMGYNSSVFNMWLVIVGIADVLFIVVTALLGFHVMSFSTLGFEELDIKRLLPQMALVFLLMNTSLFAIDGIISLSNAMVHALQAAFPPLSLWDVLTNLTQQSSSLGLGALLIMIAFLVLTVLLLIYYVVRLITLYIGAALSPILLLLYLIPAFKDFAVTAVKVYLMTIFVLFVQVVIMQLASSLFLGMLQGSTGGQPNTLMALIVGLATIWALLKTPGVMKELSFAASMPQAAHRIASTFSKSFSYVRKVDRTVQQHNAKSAKEKKKSNSGGTSSSGNGYSDQKPIPDTPKLRTGETQPAASFSSVTSRRSPSPAIEGGEV